MRLLTEFDLFLISRVVDSGAHVVLAVVGSIGGAASLLACWLVMLLRGRA